MANDILDTSFSFESLFAEATKGLIDDSEKEVDIITFCEHPFYLDQPLHAVEKLVLKVYYGISLDDKEKTIKVRSFPFDEEGKYLTEVEYVNFLIQQGRTNLRNLDPKDFIELVLVCGRRSGKTFIASVISSYEAYRLILKVDPQKYYKLPQGEEIRIVNIASTTDQALILAKATQNRILNSKWFTPYVEGKNQSEIRLRTKRDLELYTQETRLHGKPLDPHVSIKILALPCTARGIRGGSIIVGILDEIAHFIDNEGNRSGDQIYEALTPSVATFGLDGKIISISSPYIKAGIFYDLYLDCIGREGDEPDLNKIMFRIPTWEMNETITFEYLESEKKRNPESFDSEFGAEFSSIISGFFRYPEKIDACITRDSETTVPVSNYAHYIAVDPSSSQNGYALAMVHVEQKEKTNVIEGKEKRQKRTIVILDRWKVWSLRDPEFEGLPYIDEEVIHEYITSLCQKFRIVKIVFDQFDSTSSVLKFKKLGLNALKTPFSRHYNTKIYKNLRDLIYDERLDMFYHERGIKELKNLQEKRVGKKQFLIEAPTLGEITTDDLCDVLANASYIATNNEIGMSALSIVGTNGVQTFTSTGDKVASHQAYQRRLKLHKTVTNLQRAIHPVRSFR
ncbi:MAG: hypothetical protein PHF86_06635 [Candidatus Nanoarchaeia archaeon]|jgi:hypothetical protein|nr:hypothetical protein [Candidatus Nanoarchaeia archaeon]